MNQIVGLQMEHQIKNWNHALSNFCWIYVDNKIKKEICFFCFANAARCSDSQNLKISSGVVIT